MATAYILADVPFTLHTIALIVYGKRIHELLFAWEICRAAVIIIKLFVYYAFKGVYRRRLNGLVLCYCGFGRFESPINEQILRLEEQRLDDQENSATTL
jgi:hypothetical protein